MHSSRHFQASHHKATQKESSCLLHTTSRTPDAKQRHHWKLQHLTSITSAGAGFRDAHKVTAVDFILHLLWSPGVVGCVCTQDLGIYCWLGRLFPRRPIAGGRCSCHHAVYSAYRHRNHYCFTMQHWLKYTAWGSVHMAQHIHSYLYVWGAAHMAHYKMRSFLTRLVLHVCKPAACIGGLRLPLSNSLLGLLWTFATLFVSVFNKRCTGWSKGAWTRGDPQILVYILSHDRRLALLSEHGTI